MTIHHRFRITTFVTALMILGVCAGTPAAAQERTASQSRVRSSDQAMTALIERGQAHSPTFTRLVASIDASDGIVYVESGRCLGKVVACLPHWMTSSGGNRFLRIVVDRDRVHSDWQVLGSIGHELQHAIEVLSDRYVTDSRKMYYFYRQYAPTDRERFETRAAINAGITVERELHVSASEAH